MTHQTAGLQTHNGKVVAEHANVVATRNGNYGSNGNTWLRHGAILPARLLKVGGQPTV
jgi:hypothetical protein